MRKDYSGMSYDEIHSDYKRLNRKLIVPNILIAIIAIVACLSQLFLPFFKMNLKLNSEVVSALVDTAFGDEETLVDDDSNSILAAVLTKSNIKSAAENLNNSIPLELTANQMLAIAFATDDAVEETIIEKLAEVVDKMELKKQLESALNALMPSVISTAVTATIVSISDDLGEDLTEEQTAAVEACGEDITAAVQKLAEAETITDELKEEVKEDVKTSVSSTMETLGYTQDDYDEVAADIDTYFDAFVEAATDEDGNFSYVTMLENIDSLVDALSSGELTEEDLEDMYGTGESAAGAETASYALTADSSSTGEESSTATINYYLSLLDDSEEFVRVMLDSDGDGSAFDAETIEYIQLACEALFIFIALTSGLWGLLALLAILHIFMGNKKVGMWYVKLFGGLAAIIFYVMPVALITSMGVMAETMASTLGDSASLLTTFASAFTFGGSGLVVLICLLALWVVSIFACHPIKKKIKRCKKALKIAKKAEA